MKARTYPLIVIAVSLVLLAGLVGLIVHNRQSNGVSPLTMEVVQPQL